MLNPGTVDYGFSLVFNTFVISFTKRKAKLGLKIPHTHKVMLNVSGNINFFFCLLQKRRSPSWRMSLQMVENNNVIFLPLHRVYFYKTSFKILIKWYCNIIFMNKLF